MINSFLGQLSLASRITVFSNLCFRAAAYLFLRWIPSNDIAFYIYVFFLLWMVCFTGMETSNSAVNSQLIKLRDQHIHSSSSSSHSTKSKIGKHKTSTPNGIFGAEPSERRLLLRNPEPEPKHIWALLLGLPTPSNRRWWALILGVNCLLLGLVVDRIYTPQFFYNSYDHSFIRVGYVSSSTADLLIRSPPSTSFPEFVEHRAVKSSNHSPLPIILNAAQKWQQTPIPQTFTEASDFTAKVTLTGLRSDTKYEYNITGYASGFFATPPSIGSYPQGSNNTFTFLHTSCIKSRTPYTLPPPFVHPLSIKGLRQLTEWIPRLQAQFMLFLGDFIYIDVPKRFGSSREAYRREYRQVYASPEWPEMQLASGTEVPWYYVYDDHEIANDWSNGSLTAPFPAAFDAFSLYNGAVNPPAHRRYETYFSFTSGPASFFMLDTRRYRSYLHDDDTPEKSMLGAQQRSNLLAWLAKPGPRGVKWKFVISSVPFTRNWWIGGRLSGNDTWGGYMSERKVILDAMWDATAGGMGVVVLSGDRHEFAATRFAPPEGENADGGRRAVMEFSTSPLSMFWLPIKTYDTKDKNDECIAYIPNGNSKFGAIEISDAPDSQNGSKLHYRLIVDGKERWTYDMYSGQSNSAVQRFWNWFANTPNRTHVDSESATQSG